MLLEFPTWLQAMAIRAICIGIDKYRDYGIRDLTGARRDATALWALFCDSLPKVNATLVVDEEATVNRVRDELNRALNEAGEEDVVIVSFSGHGSHDHRFVFSDTAINSFETTTIQMAEVAEWFKRSKARTILFILDCCFSGGAPARVLEDSPIPRDIQDELQTIAGTGRIVIAASNIHEPAYEIPGHGHGILTKVLLDVLQSKEGTINLTAAMDEVLEGVRAEAARIGVTQTPVFLGYIEGGLTLPALKQGERFRSAFPELAGIRVTTALKDLGAYGIPAAVLAEWEARFGKGLNHLQLEAVNQFRILDGKSLFVMAPTSSGKTFIGEMAATRAVVEGRKAVFLLPYKALANEKYDQFQALYGQSLGMRVIRCTGDYTDQTSLLIRGKYDLALLTYEMFLNLVVANPHVVNQIGLVVIDEAQFITDPMRGISVELLFTYLLSARERGIAPQLIALSAVIGDINDLDSWLGCGKLVTTERPVPLIEGVLDRSGAFKFVDLDGQIKTKQLLPAVAIQVRREKPSAQDVIVPLVKRLVADGEKVIVFRNQRGPAQGCASYLSNELGLPSATDVIEALPSFDQSSTSTALKDCLNGGTAFHSTNLNREERMLVEQAFRDQASKVRVLAATTTLAAGINTPASTVILAEQEFVGEDGRPFTVAEYKNMAGRAGRLGFQEQGKAILLAETPYERERLFEQYVQGTLEPLHSSFSPDHLETWFLRLLAQIRRIPRNEVIRLLANTFGGYIAIRNNPAWRKSIEERLEGFLAQMMTLGLIEQEGAIVQLTLLGRACGRSGLAFGSCMRLVELLRAFRAQDLSAERLMALVQCLPESDSRYTPMMKRGRAEAVRQREAAAQYGIEVIQALQRHVDDEFMFLARCKRAAVLWDWIHGVPIETIEQRYTPNPFQGRVGHGDVRGIADNARFHLRSAHEICSIMFMGGGPSEESVDTLLKQLEMGIPADALDLLHLPIQMGRGDYLALYARGARTVADVFALSEDDMRTTVGVLRTAQLVNLRPPMS